MRLGKLMVSRFDPAGVAVVIPALDEAAALPLVLADLDRLGLLGATIVVDNGSRDGTPEVAGSAGARVIHEPRRGYGSACLRGIRFVREIWPATRVLVFLDGDRSDDPAFIPALADPILSGGCDFVLGSRVRALAEDGSIKFHQRQGNEIICHAIRAMFGHSYTDLGPFRAISIEALTRLGMRDRGMGWTVEMQVKAIQTGLRIREIPVPYRPRIGRSKISGTLKGSVAAAAKIGWTIVALRLRALTPSRESS